MDGNQTTPPLRSDELMENLKPEINNFLWKYLPGDITLDEADKIAMAIYEMIWKPRQYLSEKK